MLPRLCPPFRHVVLTMGPSFAGSSVPGAVYLSEDKLQALSTEIRDKLVGVALD